MKNKNFKNVRVSLSLPKEMFNCLITRSKEDGECNVSSTIRRAIKLYVDDKKFSQKM